MAKQQILYLVLVASVHHTVYAATATISANLTEDTAATAYDILEKNNLPRGLLPRGVTSYVLNPDGKIEVPLAGQCEFPITLGGEQYKFRFSSTVGGIVKPGSIQEVYGVDVQIKFGWLGFRQVDRAGDNLTFQVQQFTQSFPVSDFAVSHSCS